MDPLLEKLDNLCKDLTTAHTKSFSFGTWMCAHDVVCFPGGPVRISGGCVYGISDSVLKLACPKLGIGRTKFTKCWVSWWVPLKQVACLSTSCAF